MSHELWAKTSKKETHQHSLIFKVLLIRLYQLSIFSFPFSTFLGRSGYRRRAFRSIFARFAIASLAKDAAPIPNAFGGY